MGLDPLGEHDGRIALYLSDRLRTLLPPVRQNALAAVEPTAKERADAGRAGTRRCDVLRADPRRAGAVAIRERRWMPVDAGVARRGDERYLPCAAGVHGTPNGAAAEAGAFERRAGGGFPFPQDDTAERAGTMDAGASAGIGERYDSGHQLESCDCNQLLARYGVLTRENVAQESLPGGFSAVYDVLKAMEESGRVRRGYFVAGLGAGQFALPSAVDMLRSLRQQARLEKPEMVVLAATDPANPYGAVLRWPSLSTTESGPAVDETAVPEPTKETGARMLARAVGTQIILRNGELVAYMRRNNPNLIVFLPIDEPDRSHTARDLANFLAELGQQDLQSQSSARLPGMLLVTVNDVPVAEHFLARFLLDAGFHSSPMGFNLRRVLMPPVAKEASPTQAREVQ